ncbi:MAG: helix-turn-helix transcriptional regulator [Gammaproteobacteria bacterium]
MGVNFKLGQFYGDPQIAVAGSDFDIRAQAGTACEADVQIHTHLDAHIVLVLSGIYISSARGASEFSRAPTLIFNPPGTRHRDRFVEGVGTFVTVSVGTGSYRDFCANLEMSNDAFRVAWPSALASAFRIAREIRDQRDAVVLESSAWECFVTIDNKLHPFGDPPSWALSAYEAIMDRATEARLEVRQIAAEIGVHQVHLARVFRDCWGCSPGELIRWRRVDRCADLLRRSSMSGAEIAAAVGFVDQSHMTRAFRAAYGVAPGAYRRGHVSRIQA